MPPFPVFLAIALFFFLSFPLRAAESEVLGFKPAPVRPSMDAAVIVEDQYVLDECDADKICIEGNLLNAGARTAYRLKLRVEVGGGKYAKPRIAFNAPLERNTLNGGQRMGFSVGVKRKIPYKDKNGEAKIIEAGKYNVKLVPTWASDNKITATRSGKNTKTKKK